MKDQEYFALMKNLQQVRITMFKLLIINPLNEKISRYNWSTLQKR